MNTIHFGGLSFTLDGFRLTYAAVTAFLWIVTSLFSREYFRPGSGHGSQGNHEERHMGRYWFFIALTFPATEGVFVSADLMTALVFFEILSFTSFTWVIHEQTKEAVTAAYTYLFIAVTGGLVLLMGLSLLKHATGTLVIAELAQAAASADQGEVLAASICILFGFGAKAGMFPLHIWLPMAHPVAPAPASALLSGILTKVGVYGILMISTTAMAGTAAFGWLLLVLALITMAVGAVKALFSLNIKRTLACSSMSQIGFILTGLAMCVLMGERGKLSGEAAFALWGSILHMINHSLLKLTLFTSAGVVAMNLHELDLEKTRGFGRKKPALCLAFVLASAGISGIPLFNGYLSKTLLHEAITEGAAVLEGQAAFLHCAEWVFMVSGGFTFAYMLKLFMNLFVWKNEDPARQEAFDRMGQGMDRLSMLCVCGPAFLHLALGVPAAAVRIGSFVTGSGGLHFSPFSGESLAGAAVSLTIGAVLFFLVVPRLKAVNARVEDIKKRLGVIRRLGVWFVQALRRIPDLLTFDVKRLEPVLRRIPALFDVDEKVIKPLLHWFIPQLLGTVFEALSLLTDGLALALRRTVLRERRVRDDSRLGGNGPAALLKEADREAAPMFQNFSFALIMTCIGILAILSFLIIRAAVS